MTYISTTLSVTSNSWVVLYFFVSTPHLEQARPAAVYFMDLKRISCFINQIISSYSSFLPISLCHNEELCPVFAV